MTKLLNMEQVYCYPTNMTSVHQKTSGLLSQATRLTDLNQTIFQDLLSSTIDLGSFETIQDAGLPFEGLDTIEEVEGCEQLPPPSESLSFERTQQFIQEMDVFIKQQEENFPLTSTPPIPSPATESLPTCLPLVDPVDDETEEAIQMLDSLIHHNSASSWEDWNVEGPPLLPVTEEPRLPTVDSLSSIASFDDSFFDSPSSVTPCSTLSPASDFSPPSSVGIPPSPSSQISPRCGRRSKLNIKDKKERKKWQNVEAARRYRNKKRSLVHDYLLEAKVLEDRNSDLKSKVKEVENELSTMKKLMTELGMIKTTTPN